MSSTGEEEPRKPAKVRQKAYRAELQHQAVPTGLVKMATGVSVGAGGSKTVATAICSGSGVMSASCEPPILVRPPSPTLTAHMAAMDIEVPPMPSEEANAGTEGQSEEVEPPPAQQNYVGFPPRTVELFWEQYEHGDMELSSDACAAIAQDVSYKLWEIISNIKTFARHSGGRVTYELVNEVFRAHDIPPAIGAMDSDWERIDYDDTFFFYADRIIELRDEYQKSVTITIPHGPEVVTSVPVEEKTLEHIKTYIPTLLQIALHGETKAASAVLAESYRSPIIGTCYRLILTKLIQILSFRQSDAVSARCWALIRSCCGNKYTRGVECREEYFHLAEILICQLLAPYETISVPQQDVKMEMDGTEQAAQNYETHEMKPELDDSQESQEQEVYSASPINCYEEKVFKLVPDEDEEEEPMPSQSPYFACPVEEESVEMLCDTIGVFAASNGYLHNECMHNILRRLEKFFEGRVLSTEKEYLYLKRALSGLIVLGDFAFREAIPYFYKFKPEDVPENCFNSLARAAGFLNGPDDIFMYEWLEAICGNDKLQPYMVYHHKYHSKLQNLCLTRRRNLATYKIIPRLGMRRLEWNILAAAMCHGDDPNKALNPKPTLNQVFPELRIPLPPMPQCIGKIQLKFRSGRPVALPTRRGRRRHHFESQQQQSMDTSEESSSANSSAVGDILIARRRLFKPLTNAKMMQRTHNLLDYIM